MEFGALVGAQLNALLEAEIEATRKVSEFIELVGFERTKDQTLSLRMVSFNMFRRGVDGKINEHRISIPVLNLITIPLLTIESAQIEFSALVEDIKSNETQSSPLFALPTGKVSSNSLVTRLARTSSSDTKTNTDLRVSVKLAQSPFPLGIEHLLNAADLGVQDNVINPADPDKELKPEPKTGPKPKDDGNEQD